MHYQGWMAIADAFRKSLLRCSIETFKEAGELSGPEKANYRECLNSLVHLLTEDIRYYSRELRQEREMGEDANQERIRFLKRKLRTMIDEKNELKRELARCQNSR